MIQNRDYLKDIPFLMNLTKKKNKEIFIKAISLDFQTEREIGEVEGLIINGNFSVDGSSSVRRTGSLSIFCNTQLYEGDPLAYDINYYKQFFGISKKIDIEIGLLNDFNKNYPRIIWFQMGRYIITNATFSNNVSNGITININIGDKMNLLNGFCGGTIPASTELDKVSDIDNEGKKIERRATIYEMIMEMVNHFGGEQLGRILISDLETTTKTGLKLKDDCEKQYYIDQFEEGNSVVVIKEYIDGESPEDVKKYTGGDFIGYKSVEYTYPTKDYFTLNAGETVASGLDKIKSNIGNYEYFYDLNGNFRWQEIRDYKNTSKASLDLANLSNRDYLIDIDNGNALYNFEDSEIITSYSNNPQYSNLKNDFVIWGTKTVGEGSNKKTYPIRYHLAIDDKPIVPVEYNDDSIYLLLEDQDSDGIYTVPIYYEKIEDLPSIGEEGKIYYVKEENKIYKYSSSDEGQYIKIFSKDLQLNQNIQNFYEYVAELKNQSKEKYNYQKQIFDSYINIIFEIESTLNELSDFLNIISFLNKDISSTDLESFIDDSKNILIIFNQKCEDAKSAGEKAIQGDYLDSESNKITYNLKDTFSDFYSLYTSINTNSFIVQLNEVCKNFQSFNVAFLKKYEDKYVYQIENYKKALEDYYDSFLLYEKENNLEKKQEIQDTANSKFNFNSSNIEYNLKKINIIPSTKKTIKDYNNLLDSKEKEIENVLTQIGGGKELFNLNNQYKIGSSGATAQKIASYISELSNLLFEDNLLELLTSILNLQMNILIDSFNTYKSSWATDNLLEESERVQEKISNSINITNFYNLSDKLYLLDKSFIDLKVYSTKDEFPKVENVLSETAYFDYSTEDVYIATEKNGYYVVTGLVSIKYVFPRNWQTLLFLQNLDNFNAENNIYSTELQKEWSSLFELVPYQNENHENITKDNYIVYIDKIKDSVYSHPDTLNYWLDLIDSKSMDFNGVKVPNIGRRTLVQKNEKVNCIFAPSIPDYMIVLKDDPSIEKLEEKGQNYIEVDEQFYNENCETNGLTLYSAFDSISNTLYNYLGYNNTVNITCLPMFFLEPNIRIKLRDEASDIYGDYIIKSFSISLSNLSTMNITCTKVIDSI